MAELQDYSTTAASNNSASPAGWPEGMAPSGLNDSDRELAARIARERDDTQGVTASGGSSNAYTFAAARGTTAAYTGEMFVFRANHTNTGAATINVTPSGGSARGAVAVQKSAAALIGGEIVSGGVYAVVYDGTQYQLLNSGRKSSSSAFLVFHSAAAGNVTGDGTAYTVAWGSEIYDKGGEFASNTFTATIPGPYHFDVAIYTDGGAGTTTSFLVQLVTSNRTMTLDKKGASVFTGLDAVFGGGCDVDMDAGDTAHVVFTAAGGTKTIDLSASTFFSGHLVA